MPYRILAGPDKMCVERHGVRSKYRMLTATDGPDQIHEHARDLWGEMKHIVFWKVWVDHRAKIAAQRRYASTLEATWPGPYFPGPRPDLISQAPWRDAKHRQWKSLPRGVVGRLLKST